MMRYTILFAVLLVILKTEGKTQDTSYVLKAEWLFDGRDFYRDSLLVVRANRIVYVGPERGIDPEEPVRRIDLADAVLMPGMIEGHAHLLLHPYDETSWNDQVLKESVAERAIRAGNHARANLMAGFTTVRDLGSEGAGFTDIGVKSAVDKGVIPGPRLLVAGPAIVATGSYGPKGFADHVEVPLGAVEADGHDALIREVRRQIGGGADFIKVYADYRWGPQGQAMPTFSEEEIRLMVETARSSGRVVVAHAATEEGMRRATLAGVSTIEHGDGGTREIFDMMRQRGVALCPTLAAGDAILQYRGWKKDIEPEPARITQKKNSFKQALEAGVQIVAGGDVGVFSHGDNVRELEMMVEYGMDAYDVLRTVTADNAKTFELGHMVGRIEVGLLADVIAVEGQPHRRISDLRKVVFVMKDGKIYKNP